MLNSTSTTEADFAVSSEDDAGLDTMFALQILKEVVTRGKGNKSRRDDWGDAPFMPPYSALQEFYSFFLEFHGYASLIVCVFGIFTNVLNITVLMAKDMRTATNHLLTFIAVSDILTMLPYIPFVIHFYCPPSDPSEQPLKFSYSWILYMVIVINLLATTHAISIWLAVALAAFRFNQIRSTCPRGPLAKERRIRQVKVAAAIIYISSIIVLIPNYLSSEIVIISFNKNFNTSAFGLKEPNLGSPKIDLTILINVLTYAFLCKILPCILILIFSGSLLYHMGIKAARRRQRLSASCQQIKTTRMLLVVLVMFIFTELPQGIIIVLSALVPDFYSHVHFPLSDLTDFISLVNNAINFVLYCVMSQQFRENFFNIYIKPICERRRTMVTSNSEFLILREHVPRTMTTTTHDETLRV